VSTTGYEVDITNYDSTYGWDNPTVSAGTVEIVSTIGNIRKLRVSGLTIGQTATITQRNYLNSTYQTATVSAAATAPAPISSGGGGVTVTPIPVIEKPATFLKKTLTISGFAPGSAVLSATMKKKIALFAKYASADSHLSCIGYTMGPTVLKNDHTLAKRRSISVCSYLSSLKPEINSVAWNSVNTKFENSKYRKTLVTLSK
jgi:outer membrane protein OmpA-like peptidoglycan-associated protein